MREGLFGEEKEEGEIDEKEEMSPRARGQSCSFLRVAEAGSERSRVKAVKGREKEERAGRVARPSRETTSERKVKALSPRGSRRP